MKIGLVMISNRPRELAKFVDSLHKLGAFRSYLKLSVVAQPPFHGEEDCLKAFDCVKIMPAVNSWKVPFPFLGYRMEAMKLLPDVDWYWQVDDDSVIRNGMGKVFRKTAEEYYMDVKEYLEQNEDVGVLSCRGYFGGYASKYNFVKNPPNKMIETGDGGLFLKNNGFLDRCDDSLVGAVEETYVSYKILDQGLLLARRYNSPITRRKTTKVGAHHANISYDTIIIADNIQGAIRRDYDDPDWTLEKKKFPKGLA